MNTYWNLKRSLNEAFADFEKTPSASNFTKLEQAMIAYQQEYEKRFETKAWKNV